MASRVIRSITPTHDTFVKVQNHIRDHGKFDKFQNGHEKLDGDLCATLYLLTIIL